MTGLPGFARLGETGLILYLRVTPNAGRDAIDGSETRDDGTTVLRLRVAAVPDKGRANEAVIALLARALGRPKSSLSVVSGETARLKTILATGPVGELSRGVAALGG